MNCPQCGNVITRPYRRGRAIRFCQLECTKRFWKNKGTKAAFVKLKNQVYQMYGSACACCHETSMVFLTIDHLNNDGASDRKRLHRDRTTIYRAAIKEPNRFQILCRNCNWAKSRGPCPHKETDLRRTCQSPEAGGLPNRPKMECGGTGS